MDSIFNKEKLEEFRKEHKLQPFRIQQIFHEIFKNSILDFQEMTTLSKDLRDQLASRFYILPFTVKETQEWPDTTKFLLQLADGNVIEAIIMMHFHNYDLPEDEQKEWQWSTKEKKLNRLTLCLSSQVWCPVGCIFCVTGKLWFIKNLDDEIIFTQLLYANNYIKNKFWKKEDGTRNSIRNVVFMGMWEPLLNYDNVRSSIEVMLDRQKFSLSKRHITISTSGIVPGIQKMIDDNLDVMLAISLHAPNQELRKELIPSIASNYTLDNLMKQLDTFVEKTDKRIFYEYIMIKDKTDSSEIAKELANLIKPRKKHAHINLIPYNENPAIDLEESDHSKVVEFKKILENHGLTVTLRETMGRNVQGACWQLGYEKVYKHREEIKKTGKNIRRLGRH